MNTVFSAISNLFSTTGVIAFILGVLAEYIFLKLRCRYLDKTHPEEGRHIVKFKRVYIVWALVFIVIGGLTYKTQTTYERIINLTQEQRDCSRQFNKAITVRGDIAKEEADLNRRWQDIQFGRTRSLNELSKTFGNSLDPRYVEAKAVIDDGYYRDIADLFEDRRHTADRRANTPYPQPTCGQ